MKRRITLSGNKMKSKEAMHSYLAGKLHLPTYYGKNLDALHDCLCEVSEPLHLTVTYTERIISQLGEYGETFLDVLKDSARENKNLSLVLFSGGRLQH